MLKGLLSSFGFGKAATPVEPVIQLAHMPQWCVEQPPLGIAYLTGYLKSRGYKVKQVDYSVRLFAELPEEKKYLLESAFHERWIHEREFYSLVMPHIESWIDAWADELARTPGRVIGFTMLTTSRLCTLEVIRRVKKIDPAKFIVVGGPHVTRYEGGPKIIAENDVDIVVPGEGEEVFYEIVKALEEGTPLDEIKGLLIKKDGVVFDSGERPLIQGISDLPFPEFAGFDLKHYRSLTLPILGSRGCIYKCAFCSETVLWRRYRFRSGENMFLEFKRHSEELGINSFYIVDSLINGNLKELEHMCDLIIEAGLKVYWSGKASIRRQMTPELLNKMARAGCTGMDYGLESGSAQIVKDMKKGFDLPTARRVIRETHEAGISVGLFLLAGFPTETEEHFLESLEFLKEHVPFVHHVTPGYGMGIQAGSDVQLHPEKYGIYFKNGNWYSEHTTPEIRLRRVERLREFCNSLDVFVS